MNLKSIYTGLALSLIMIFAITGCNKEAKIIATDDSQYQEQTLINDADNEYNDASFTEGTETTEFTALNDGMPEAYTLVETDMDDAGYKRGIEKRFLHCLRELNLSDTQVKRLRMAFRAYEECKAYDIKSHREAYAKLLTRVENARKELVYKLRAGTITKAEFEAAMKHLRVEFQEALRKIKADYAHNLKACYDKFVRHLRSILTDRQWKAFIDCYRHK